MSKNKTLELSLETAKELYPTAAPEFKKLLEGNFTKSELVGSVIDRVKTLEDACEELGIDYDDLFDNAVDDYDRAETAIKTFAKALREGKPASECWYYPYFYRSSGGGFSFCDYVYGYGYSFVGARLRVDTPEKATHLGNRMLQFYKTYINDK